MSTPNSQTTTADPWIGIRLPHGEWFYDPAQPLGPAGGFGEVFAGKSAVGDPVAIKRLKMTTGEAAHRELKIAQQLAGKSFNHILAIFDSGEDANGGGYFVVMPRADRSLADELVRRGLLPVDEGVDVLRQVAEGIRELTGIVHRDLKPANVLLHDGAWKIADLGIARFVEDSTSANTVKGFRSAPYAAPEQWRGEHATPATDVYGFSCIGYAVLSGGPPFKGPAPADFQRQHMSEDPPILTDTDPRLRAILSAGLRKPQSGRPTIDRVVSVLREIAAKPATAHSKGIAALQLANAAEVERMSAEAVEDQRLRREAEEQAVLLSDCQKAFALILHRICEVLRENAPEAGVHGNARSLSIGLGGAADLMIQFQGPISPDVRFPNAKWDVVAIGWIKVRQSSEPSWSHGATLWYMRLRRESGYRWHEVAYKRGGLFEGPLTGSFPIHEMGHEIYTHADLAAGPGVHTIEIESGPTPIDDEDLDAFVERWLARLGEAYHGRLRPF